jgi:hypothetical protein
VNEHGASVGASLGPVSAEPRVVPKVRHESFWAIFWAAVVVNCAMSAFRAAQELRRA